MQTTDTTSFWPLDDELLRQYDFFELYPFDGGGHFIQQGILGGGGDRELVRRIVGEDALAPFRQEDGTIDYLRFEFWRTIERSCWINRMYYVVPLARVAWLDGDAALARRCAEALLDFHRRYRPPQSAAAIVELNRRVLKARDEDYNCGNLEGATEYQWFDFQPASRVLHTLYCIHFLRGFACVTAAEREELREMVRENAEVIFLGEEARELHLGNHQMLRGLTLLYAGVFLDEERYRKSGVRIVEYHILNDYLADGMLIDLSPSYHLFETWISRDAMRLAEFSPEAKARFHKAASICRGFTVPDGTSLVLNDGYPLRMDGFLQSLGPGFDAVAEETVLSEAHIALLHTPQWFAALDGTPVVGRFSHAHGGQIGLTLWADGEPFVVESGCCSYDDEDFCSWFKSAEAHATMVVDGAGCTCIQGLCECRHQAEIQAEAWRGHAVALQAVSPATEWKGVRWRRSIAWTAEECVVTDEVEADAEHRYTFFFPCAPDVQATLADDAVTLARNGARLRLTWKSTRPLSWRMLPGKVMWEEERRAAPRLAADCEGGSFRAIWRFRRG